MNQLSEGLATSAIEFNMPLIPKYAPLKQFQCIFPSQNQENVKFLPEIVIF